MVVHTNPEELEHDYNHLSQSWPRPFERQTAGSEKQAAAIKSLRDEIFLNTVDSTAEDGNDNVGIGNVDSLDINSTLATVVEAPAVTVYGKVVPQNSAVPDPGPQSEFLESLTQKSPAIESKIAQLVDNIC